MAYRWTLTNLADNTSEVLSKDPIGWDEGIYKISRSEKFKGAFNEYTTSLKFHCLGGGKSFIDAVYNTDDIDGKITLLVEYDCDGSGTYDTLFLGMINLASYKSDNDFTYVNVEYSDLLMKVQSRSEIPVDLEATTSIGGETITPISVTTIPLSPIEIDFKSRWVIDYPYEQEAQGLKGDPDLGTDGAQFQPKMVLQNNDFTTSNQYPEISNISNVVGQIFYGTASPPLVEFNELGLDYPLTLNWSIDLSGGIIDSVPTGSRDIVFYRLYLVYGDFSFTSGVPPTRILLYDSGASSANPATFVFNVVDSGTISINPGDKISLAWVVDWNNTGDERTQNVKFQYQNSFFEINSKTTFMQTDCKCILVHEALNAVVDAIADSDGNFESEFYGREDSQKQTYAQDGAGAYLAITNGLNIRAFNDKRIYCSLDDIFQSLDCLHNIGLGMVNGKVRVEPLEYWFSNTKILTLPNVPNFNTVNNNKLYYNRINIGYQRWETEFRNGLDEPCTKHEYSTKIAKVKNTYTRLSKYIASSFAWELTRRKNINLFPDEDFTYDNENFFLSVVRYDYGSASLLLPELYSDSFNTGTGMVNLNTAYNLRLTPKRLLLAHLNQLTPGLQKINGDISFVNGEGNTTLQLAMDAAGVYQEDFNGQLLGEDDSIAWNETDAANIAPIWLPETYTFEYPISYADFKLIKANPYGYIEFYKDATNKLNGYIMNMEYSMKTGLTKFELLKKP